ncbi:MAG TPA: NADH-quinone oxidoreductase subunit K [Acidimicrobiales bacterium]|jgi:NAD(P)H-quinone oxidoreductase subunit 4L|nr:NADH-quinone oxidoreductase subunit K [Acidimicrobiales bacterium]
MSLEAVLVVAAALVGLGLWGALSQQSIVMVLMGIELIVNGAMLAGGGLWAYAAGGAPEGQLLVIVAMAVMAVEMAVGFALLVALYRTRQVDMTDGLTSLRR